MKNKVLMAQCLKVKGLKGEVKLKSYAEDPLAITKYTLVDESGVVYKVTSAYQYKESIFVKFNGVDSKEVAEKLLGKNFYIYHEDLPKLEENHYYIIDLVGLKVLTSNKKNIGVVVAAHNFGAGDIVEVKLANSTVMLPFDNEIILEVNLKQAEIILSDAYKEYL